MALSKSNIINLGGDKLNINTTDAKGLEKVIGIIATFIIRAQQGVNKIVYGDIKKKYKNKVNNKGDISTAMNNGLLSIVDTVSSIDICNVLNDILNQIPGGKGFDPNSNPETNNPIERAKYALQKAAYEIQLKIDKFSSVYIDPNNIQSRIAVSSFLNEITQSLNAISDPVSQIGLTNPQLQKAFPNISVFNNFIQDIIAKFNQYTDTNQIPLGEIEKILKKIEQIKSVCIAIQGLNSVNSAISFVDSTFNVGIQDQIAKIQKIINPARLIPLLKAILRTANNINSIGKKVLGYVKTGQVIIRVLLLIRKVLIAVDKFLLLLQIPAIFTTTGATLALTKTQTKLKDLIEKIFQRLGQINAVLNLIIIFVENLLIIINEIIIKLRIILLNLEQCQNVDKDLIQETKDTVDSLVQTQKDLQTFINTYNTNKKLIDTRFGEYNIDIVTEQVVDEGINLKRRYGVAVGMNGVIVAQSTPTFASLDQIIINEVKVLLVSKGLVKSDLAGISPDEITALLESARFLEEGSIDLETLSISPDITIDLEEDEAQELGLQTFVNNLPGGKALRKKVRKRLAKSNRALIKDLKSADPEGRYSKSIISKKEKENKESQIKELESEKKELVDSLKGSSLVARFKALARIAQIDKEIKNIKNSQK